MCLNILREDWKPVLNLNAVIVGMQVRLPIFFSLYLVTRYNMVVMDLADYDVLVPFP